MDIALLIALLCPLFSPLSTVSNLRGVTPRACNAISFFETVELAYNGFGCPRPASHRFKWTSRKLHCWKQAPYQAILRDIEAEERRYGAVIAKYGDKSVYFDLEDIGNTIGQWDFYRSDTPSPYNPFHSNFFETFADAFTKRGLLLKFLILGGVMNSAVNYTPPSLKTWALKGKRKERKGTAYRLYYTPPSLKTWENG